VPISAAIAGSEVAMTVESMFSMNKATATISGTMRFANMSSGTEIAPHTLAELSRPQTSAALRCAHGHLHQGNPGAGVSTNDLRRGSPCSPARPPAERPAVCSRLQRCAAGGLLRSRTDLSRAFLGAVGPCGDRGFHEAREPQAPRAGGCDRAAWLAAR